MVEKSYVKTPSILEHLYKLRHFYCINTIVVVKSHFGNFATGGNAELFRNLFKVTALDYASYQMSKVEDKEAHFQKEQKNDIYVLVDKDNC
jgi:hypothetical protein